jgi:hypothetical protein
LAALGRLPGALARELKTGAATTALAVHPGARRRVAFARATLGQLKEVASAAGGGATVNDALLAAVAGGLREWLASRGAEPPHLRAKVPVSMHHDGEDHAAGNRDSFWLVDLPLGEPEAVERVRAVAQETRERKRHHDADALYASFDDLAKLSRPLYRRVTDLTATPRAFTLSVSNVPGPRGSLAVLGAPVHELHTLAEIGERHALRAAALSCDGALSVGLCADAEAVPDLDVLAAAVQRALTSVPT